MANSYPQELAGRTLFDNITTDPNNDIVPLWDSSASHWEQTTVGNLLNSKRVAYVPNVNASSNLAALQSAFADGSNYKYEVRPSIRPTTPIPNWNTVITVTTNPFGTVPDVVMADGWNAGGGSGPEDPTKPGGWRAWESYYAPGGAYYSGEYHTTEVYMPNGTDWNGPRRSISVSTFNIAGFGVSGGVVQLGHDTDLIYAQSTHPSNNHGAQVFFQTGVSFVDGSTSVQCNSAKKTGVNATIQMQASGGASVGTTTLYSDSLMTLTSSGAGTVLGGNSTKIGFYGLATPISKPTITGAKGGNAALTSLLSQLAALGLITDSTT